MPYVTYSHMPESLGVGRGAHDVSYKADTGADWVGIVDVVGDNAHEIDESMFVQISAANAEHNAALPPVPEPTPVVSKWESVAPLLHALASALTVAGAALAGGRSAEAGAALAQAGSHADSIAGAAELNGGAPSA